MKIIKDQEAKIYLNSKKIGDIINLVIESKNSKLIDKVISIWFLIIKICLIFEEEQDIFYLTLIQNNYLIYQLIILTLGLYNQNYDE